MFCVTNKNKNFWVRNDISGLVSLTGNSTAIRDGVYYAGVSADPQKMDYAKGGTTWSPSHIVTYPNGKRTIITIKGSRWRA